MKDQVRRMAENDEPKCRNCKHWVKLDTHGRPGNMGLCNLIGHADPLEADLQTLQSTTDLSLCSAWELKE